MIGAGVAGLSCARRLAQHGVETLVLERDTVAGGASGRNGGFLIAGLAPFYNDAVELYGRDYARRVYARTLAVQAEIYALAAELGVGDAVRRVGSLRVSSSEDEAEHVRRHVGGAARRRLPGAAARARRAAARPAPERPERLPHRARRRAPPGALRPRAGGGRRACRGADPRAQRGPGARERARRRPAGHRRRQRARPPRDRGRRRRPARARSVLRGTRAGAPPPHGGDRAAARADLRPARLRPLGLRVLPAAARRAHPGRRLRRSRRRGVIHGPGRRRRADLGSDRALPARGARRGGRGHASLDRDGRLQRGQAPVRRRRAGPPGAVGGGRLLGHRQRARLPGGPGAGRHGRRREGGRAAVPS